MEMNQILCQMKVDKKTEEIKLVNLSFGREMRVHEEIMSAYLEFQNVLFYKICLRIRHFIISNRSLKLSTIWRIHRWKSLNNVYVVATGIDYFF